MYAITALHALLCFLPPLVLSTPSILEFSASLEFFTPTVFERCPFESLFATPKPAYSLVLRNGCSYHTFLELRPSSTLPASYIDLIEKPLFLVTAVNDEPDEYEIRFMIKCQDGENKPLRLKPSTTFVDGVLLVEAFICTDNGGVLMPNSIDTGEKSLIAITVAPDGAQPLAKLPIIFAPIRDRLQMLSGEHLAHVHNPVSIGDPLQMPIGEHLTHVHNPIIDQQLGDLISGVDRSRSIDVERPAEIVAPTDRHSGDDILISSVSDNFDDDSTEVVQSAEQSEQQMDIERQVSDAAESLMMISRSISPETIDSRDRRRTKRQNHLDERFVLKHLQTSKEKIEQMDKIFHQMKPGEEETLTESARVFYKGSLRPAILCYHRHFNGDSDAFAKHWGNFPLYLFRNNCCEGTGARCQKRELAKKSKISK
jgi:hypothetical protein